MIKTIQLAKTACQLVRNSMKWCFNSSNKNTETKWINMAKKIWVNSNICKKNKNQKKTQFKIRFKRSNKSVLKIMLCLVILSFQQMILLFTKIQLNHLSMQWICQWLNGNDHKKLFLKTQLLLCTEMQWIQEILSKEHWVIVGSLDLFWFKVQIQNY